MNSAPTIVFFFNDWKVYPGGINAGGGESALMALALAFSRRGHKVIACANLPEGECSFKGIDFWNFGNEYRLQSVADRLKGIGPYYCYAATLVHPFILIANHANCLAKILINHSPSAFASGLEPATVMNIVDRMTCVSQAQRNLMLIRGTRPEKIRIVKNGFDPEIFTYAGPEGRNWKQLIFIGRLEHPKGIHLALEAYMKLIVKFPDLALSIFGDSSPWPSLVQQIESFRTRLPGLKYEGKVPQPVLAQHLRTAGLLIFPSTSFESAGLAVVDAQASGCPVLASAVGGVPEYLFERECGEIFTDISTDGLAAAIEKLILQPDKLKQMSLNCEKIARSGVWDDIAARQLEIAQEVCTERSRSFSRDDLKVLPIACQQTIGWRYCSVSDLMTAHETISSGKQISLTAVEEYCSLLPDYAAPFLWRGLITEKTGKLHLALAFYHEALKRSQPSDWQVLLRLAMILLEDKQIEQARTYAREILRYMPEFQFPQKLRAIVDNIDN